jgi:hypothetical protein
VNVRLVGYGLSISRYQGIYNVGTVETGLVVCRPIGKSEWEKTLLRDAVVIRGWGALERNGYSEWFNVNDIKE